MHFIEDHRASGKPKQPQKTVACVEHANQPLVHGADALGAEQGSLAALKPPTGLHLAVRGAQADLAQFQLGGRDSS